MVQSLLSASHAVSERERIVARDAQRLRDARNAANRVGHRDPIIYLYKKDMLELKSGKTLFKYHFPVKNNQFYQLLGRVQFKNTRTGEDKIVGMRGKNCKQNSDFGRGVCTEWAASKLHANPNSDFDQMVFEMKVNAYLSVLTPDADPYKDDGWWAYQEWQIVRVLAFGIVCHRNVKLTPKGNMRKVRPFTSKDLKEKKSYNLALLAKKNAKKSKKVVPKKQGKKKTLAGLVRKKQVSKSEYRKEYNQRPYVKEGNRLRKRNARVKKLQR